MVVEVTAGVWGSDGECEGGITREDAEAFGGEDVLPWILEDHVMVVFFHDD